MDRRSIIRFALVGFLLAAALLLWIHDSRVNARGAVSLATVQGSSGLQFSEHLLRKDYSYAYGICASDLDGDGDLDLTSADYTPHNALYWFENDGKGSFQHHFIQKDDPERLERHVIADMNGDGRPDVVIVENFYGDLKWFENPGRSAIRQPWKRHYITEGGLLGAYDVDVADFDRDGDMDVAASSWRLGNRFVWYENPGIRESQEWTAHVIDSGLAETRTIRVADFDGDGDADVLGTAAAAGVVIWYENRGKQTSWKRHVIDLLGERPTHGQPVDMDADGDPDVVMALGFGGPLGGKPGQIVWYENQEKHRSGSRWVKHLIAEPFEQAFEAVAGDLDGDGDQDVVATAWGKDGQIAWFENPGNPRGQWTKHVLKDHWPNANQVILADLNGDGRLDIAAVAERGSQEFRWWRNEGRSRP